MTRAGLLVAVSLSVLTACTSVSGPAPTDPTTRSAPVADQQSELQAQAADLRPTVDALAALVPDVTLDSPLDDRAVNCRVGIEDDGSKRWVYARNLRYAGTGADVIDAAGRELEQRGFEIRRRQDTPEESSFTALRDGVAVRVLDGPLEEGGAAIAILGYGACVATDGTVDTRNPS